MTISTEHRNIVANAAAGGAAIATHTTNENANPNKLSPMRTKEQGSNVTKLAARYDSVRTNHGMNSPAPKAAIRRSTRIRNKKVQSKETSYIILSRPISVVNTTKNKYEPKDERRRRLLQERQSQKQLTPVRDSKDIAILTKANTARKERGTLLDMNEASTSPDKDLFSLASAATGAIHQEESTTSSTSFQRGGSHALSAILFCFQLALLTLALYEVQHYHHFSPTARVFSAITEMTGCDDVFHVAFVFCFGVRAIVSTLISASKSFTRKSEKDKILPCILKAVLLFVLVATFWVVVLPIFQDCGLGGSDIPSQFCLFIEKSTEHKGKNFQDDVIHVSNPRYSLFDLLAREWIRTTKFVVKSKIKGRVLKEVQRGLWSPFAFHGRLKTLFRVLRWAKFLAPLVGTCNKFRGHILDMIKKRRQHIKSKAAQKRWTELLDALSKRSKLERAVLTLQKRFRENREEKTKRRMVLMSPQRNASNSRMAHHIRQRLVEEQKLSRSKINNIEALHRERQLKRQVSQDERKNITKHKESERKLKKRLLLSPKTSFAVGWKYFTIFCVALEISQIIFAPMLSGELKKIPLDKFLLRVLNASASSCDNKSRKKTAVTSIFVPVINNLGDITCAGSTMRQAWLVMAHVIATILVPLVNTIFFLDVFVTFFTGELTSAGTLVPKPLFTRFILPGIGLQLIVNPAMIEISRVVKVSIVHATCIGPSLCFHLIVACAPFAAYCYDKLLDVVFDFVERQNKVVAKK